MFDTQTWCCKAEPWCEELLTQLWIRDALAANVVVVSSVGAVRPAPPPLDAHETRIEVDIHDADTPSAT